ncbi:PAS domain S-box protein [Pseudomonas psychrotolerans]|uniref:hybrid sensor histidine kinase/response regulator n=1 Tax=Pseudomonas oryzihabitans TaxID=47885 RepID=UPI00031359B3|nr:ATP-binding protein [Pseudomonas psychrotolerans]MBA1182091.1 PAS domain S-box protein [Pseudomonas psychrotolerans]MBA1211445.1 PAS domain S-box protein [Pseudomonas psychrotolerans]
MNSSDTEFRGLFEQSPFGIARVQMADAAWLDVNQALCQMLGRSPAELLATPWQELIHPEDAFTEGVSLDQMQGIVPKTYIVEKRLLHKQGHYLWAKLTFSVVRTLSSPTDHEFVVIEDISERKRAEEALALSRLELEKERTWLQAIVDTIPTGLIMLDEHGTLLLQNAEWKRTWGGQSVVNAPVDYSLYKGFDPETGEPIPGEQWPCALSVKEGIHTRDAVVDIERFNGTRGTIVVSSAPIRDGDGRVVGAVAANMDISELRAAQAELADINQRKDEFLAMLSHELRSPLGAILNAVQLLARHTADDNNQAYINVVQRQSRVLKGLVDDLLDVSRITRGLIELRQERLDIGVIVDRALESVQQLMDEKDHELSVTLPRKAVEVMGDSTRLEQVLVNLLINAAKYTDVKGRIELRLERDADRARISIRDNGVGIASDMREHIFDLFRQAERGLARSQGGLGIGLTIVKTLVEQHSGQVEVHSDGLGKGAEFVVSLPLAQPYDQVQLPTQTQQPVATTQTLPLFERSGGKRVLVVDDIVDIALTLALLLEESGHTVTTAHDGPAALKKAEEEAPDIILLDIGLPGMDGYEVVRHLRKNPRLASKAIAALTGYGQANDKQLAMDAGFDQHFTKPVDIAVLEQFIATAGGA